MTRFAARPTVLGLFVGLAAFSLAGCASGAAPAWSFPPAPAAVPAAAQGQAAEAQQAAAHPAAAQNPGSANSAYSAPRPPAAASAPSITRLDLTIVTGDMIGKTEYPAYVPSDFTLPAYSTVVITVTNFDDATALPKGSESYAQASGLVGGTFTTTPINLKNPNGSAGQSQTLSALDPAAVSHTFTIPALGINVPIAAHARETFTITTGAPGTFAWRCMDPCGAGPVGWGTAMAARRNYMEGTLTVA